MECGLAVGGRGKPKAEPKAAKTFRRRKLSKVPTPALLELRSEPLP